MDIALVRVDNRLVHGQILEAWIPSIRATCIVVVDDNVASDFFRETVIRMAVPSEVEVKITTIENFSRHYKDRDDNGKKTIVLFSSIGDVLRAVNLGFKLGSLNIGNVYNETCGCQHYKSQGRCPPFFCRLSCSHHRVGVIPCLLKTKLPRSASRSAT